MLTRARPLSRRELEAIFRAVQHPNNTLAKNQRRALVVLYCTGLRAREFCLLEPYMVDFENRVLRVPKHIRKGKTLPITVPLSSRASRALSALIIAARGKKYVAAAAFARGVPSPISLWRIVKRAAARAGVLPSKVGTVSPHSFRKSYAGEIFRRSGKNIFMVQRALGHRYLHNTLYYLPWWNEELPEVS